MIINIFKLVLKSPKTGWEILSSLEPTHAKTNVGHKIVLLISIIAGLLSFTGIIIHHNESVNLAFRYFGFSSLKWIISLYAASFVISKLSKGFKGNLLYSNTLIVVAVCASFLVVFTSLIYIFPTAKVVLYALSALGAIYLYYAFTALSGVSKERVPGFLLISLLIFALLVFFSEMILVVIFSIPVHL